MFQLFLKNSFPLSKILMSNCLFFGLNKLNKFIKGQENILLKFSNKNAVYKIPCKDCDASYVGQTGRKLGTRISEHRKYIKSSNMNRLMITKQST